MICTSFYSAVALAYHSVSHDLQPNIVWMYVFTWAAFVWEGVLLLMHTHEDKPLSTLSLLFPFSSPSVELVLAGSGAQEFVIFNCVPRDLCLCCSISLQWARVEQV